MYRTEDMLPNHANIVEVRTASACITPGGIQGEFAMVQHWYETIVCNGYSRRGFSRAEDRLVALAGVAEIWQQRVGDIYLAGHWAPSFAFGSRGCAGASRVFRTDKRIWKGLAIASQHGEYRPFIIANTTTPTMTSGAR